MTQDAERLTERQIEKILREHGVDSVENQGLHGWRCRWPERYGHCNCFQQLVKSLREALSRQQSSAAQMPVSAMSGAGPLALQSHPAITSASAEPDQGDRT